MRFDTRLLLLSLVLVASSARPAGPPIRREAIEWCDVWMPNMNDHTLPRVLLIGDSITRAYFPAVERKLQGKAYVARIATSKAIGDAALLAEVSVFLGEVHFDVVHFNVGMHGWEYSEDEYRHHLPALVTTIRKHARGARLIWASTTPVRVDGTPGPSKERIQARNAIAREFMSKAGIPIDDLYGLMEPHADLHSDHIHFNQEGSAMMGDKVAEATAKLLPQ
ncbi:MAG: SGNH/GDSL hydrolase family protein [Bryobacteraceae bacterium]